MMKKAISGLLITLVLLVLFSSSCKPISTWENESGIILPRSMCSSASRDCQTHWMLCSFGCVESDDHKKITDDNALTIKQTCSRYMKNVRDKCEDVRHVRWEEAVCRDYKTGWCDDYTTTCDEKPKDCK